MTASVADGGHDLRATAGPLAPPGLGRLAPLPDHAGRHARLSSALVAVLLLVRGHQMRDAYAVVQACTPQPRPPRCRFAFETLPRHLRRHRPRSERCSSGCRRLIGAFAGAPLLARELETGTFRYAWTQGVGRTALAARPPRPGRRRRRASLAGGVRAADDLVPAAAGPGRHPAAAARQRLPDHGLAVVGWALARLRPRRAGRAAHPPRPAGARGRPWRLDRAGLPRLRACCATTTCAPLVTSSLTSWPRRPAGRPVVDSRAASGSATPSSNQVLQAIGGQSLRRREGRDRRARRRQQSTRSST